MMINSIKQEFNINKIGIQLKIEIKKQLDMIIKKELLENPFPNKIPLVFHGSQSSFKKNWKQKRHS